GRSDGRAGHTVAGARPRPPRLHRLHGLHDAAERGAGARPRGDRTGRGSGGIWPRGCPRTGGLEGGAGALAQAVLWRPEAWSAGPYVRGNPGDDALDEHLFRQPSAVDGPAATTADLGQGPREDLRRDANADGPAARQSVPPAPAPAFGESPAHKTGRTARAPCRRLEPLAWAA